MILFVWKAFSSFPQIFLYKPISDVFVLTEGCHNPLIYWHSILGIGQSQTSPIVTRLIREVIRVLLGTVQCTHAQKSAAALCAKLGYLDASWCLGASMLQASRHPTLSVGCLNAIERIALSVFHQRWPRQVLSLCVLWQDDTYSVIQNRSRCRIWGIALSSLRLAHAAALLFIPCVHWALLFLLFFVAWEKFHSGTCRTQGWP